MPSESHWKEVSTLLQALQEKKEDQRAVIGGLTPTDNVCIVTDG